MDEREAATDRLLEVLDRLAGLPHVDDLADTVLGPPQAPHWSHVHANLLAEELSARGRVDDALEVLDAVLARFPDQTPNKAWLYRTRGELHHAIHRQDLAQLDLDAAKASMDPLSDPMIGMLVESLRAQIYLDLGLFEPALRASRAARAAADASLAAQLQPAQAEIRDLNRWNLRVNPEVLHYLVQYGMKDYEGAVQTLDALLSDLSLFPPEPELSRLSERQRRLIAAADADFRMFRGGSAVQLFVKERALGRPERAIEAAAMARGDLEPLLGLDVGQAIEVGRTAAHLQRGLLSLAHLECLERSPESAQRVLARLTAGIEAGFFDRTTEFIARALEARVQLLQLELRRAPESAAADGDAHSNGAAWKDSLELDAEWLATAMRPLETDWLRLPRQIEGLGFLGKPSHRMVIETLIDLEFALDPVSAPRRVFELAVCTLSIGILAQRIGGPRLVEESLARAADYLAALPPESGVLIVLPLPTQSIVMAADAEGVRASRVPSQYVLEGLAEALNREAGAPPPSTPSAQSSRSSRLSAASDELSAALFPPEIGKRVSSWKRIVFVGTELFGRPPMESLTLAGRSIGATHATSYAPGLALADVLMQRWPATRREMGVRMLAGPRRDDELGLDLAPDAARALRELVEPAGLRLGSDARLDQLGLGTLDQVQVLAFLAHGHYLLDSFRPAAVALAPWPGRPDGLMTCADVEALGPRVPPLILFLTCGSATGPQIEGDSGVADLGGAALLGGASCALVTTSDIALTAATALLDVFLRELKTGRPPDEALLEARRSLAQREGFDDPFYLHSVRLFGVAHLPLVSAPPDGNPGRSR